MRICLSFLLLFSLAWAQENLLAPVVLVRSGGESGTAFMVGQKDDWLYLATAYHVISGLDGSIGDPQDIQLTFRGRQTASASVFSTEPSVDLAVLRCRIPAGLAVPSSYLPATAPPAFDQAIRVVGHPLGENWDIVRGAVKEGPDPQGKFSITPTGIHRGCSGGPVLTADYQLLGMVQTDGLVKATCLHSPTILNWCDYWKVPTNLLTGVPQETPEIDTRYPLLMQRANAAYQAKRWAYARNLYQQAQALSPSDETARRIQDCDQEIKRDKDYQRLLRRGLDEQDLETALTYYRQAQQQRDTEQIRQLIREAEQTLADLQAQLPDYDLPRPRMTRIPGGSFRMGSNKGDDDEKPTHSVQVPTFYLGTYEVTVAEFEAFVLASGYQTDAETGGGSYFWNGTKKEWEKKEGIYWKHDAQGELRPRSEYNHPVIHVSWNDAQAYCAWLSEQTGQTYRLPTEAEWEYAAGNGRAHTRYSWGNGEPKGKAGGNVADERAKKTFSGWTIFEGYDDSYTYTAPVGQYDPNDFGLYDLSGNVWEWCQDWYHSSYEGAPTDGSAWEDPKGSYRVLRGGSWDSYPQYLRVALRLHGSPTYRNLYIGFRLARTP